MADKVVDRPTAAYGISTTGVVTPLNLIGSGYASHNRVGREILMTSVHVTGNIISLRSAAFPDYARVLIIYDTQPNGALATMADILETIDQTGAASTTSYSNWNIRQEGRFIVLCDHRIVLPSQTVTTGQVTTPGWTDPVSPTFLIDIHERLNLITRYKGDSVPAVIGEIATGSLLLCTIGFRPAGTEGYAAQLESRLCFQDY